MRFAEIRLRIASMQELRRIVSALRSLASMRMQQAVHTLPSVRQYGAAIATAIADVVPLLPEQPSALAPPRRGRRALILCTSEQGFVGNFNEQLFEAAALELKGAEALLFVLGTRGSTLAEGRNWKLAWSGRTATRIASLTEAVERLAGELYRVIAHGEVTSVQVIFARYRHGAAPAVERHALFPLELDRSHRVPASAAPLHNLPPAVLLEKLVAEYVFALLTEAAIETLASENAARFNAMGAAQDNLARKLEQLEQQGREARQEEVTTELLDLVTGAEAAGSLDSDRPSRA
jgi:F-type H+-transporting ATPase subunit gamma